MPVHDPGEVVAPGVRLLADPPTSRTLCPGDHRVRGGWPVASPSRTMLDLAVTLRRHGLEPSLEPQVVHTPDGPFEVDLTLPGGITIECHGIHHLAPEQLARDLAKSNALWAAGRVPLAIDFPTFRDDPDAFVANVVRASAQVRAGTMPPR